jgi:hypothetical protein
LVRAYSIALAGLALLAGTSTARAECRPAAVPQGDPDLVSSLTARLAASGIDTHPDPRCPAVRVQVALRGQQVHLRVTDAYERLGEREVQDVATAAAIIESWTLQEIEAGSMPADTPAAIAPSAPPAAKTPWFGIGAAFRTAVTEQSSTWMGATVSGCARIAWSCVGATLGLAKDIEATGATSTGDHHLLQLDTRATAEVPRALAGFVISPGISLGHGAQRITSTHLDSHMLPVTQIDWSHALRAGMQVRVSRAVSPRLAIFTELSADRSLARSGLTGGPASWFGLALGARFGSP